MKGGENMEYSAPKVIDVSLGVKGVEREHDQPDGPSKCSNSCCYYRDGSTW